MVGAMIALRNVARLALPLLAVVVATPWTRAQNPALAPAPLISLPELNGLGSAGALYELEAAQRAMELGFTTAARASCPLAVRVRPSAATLMARATPSAA